MASPSCSLTFLNGLHCSEIPDTLKGLTPKLCVSSVGRGESIQDLCVPSRLELFFYEVS